MLDIEFEVWAIDFRYIDNTFLFQYKYESVVGSVYRKRKF